MFQFTHYSEKKFLKLDKNTQAIIIEKLEEIRDTKNLSQLNTLKNFEPATHRLRIGDYRLILAKTSGTFLILDVGHRREIYMGSTFYKIYVNSKIFAKPARCAILSYEVWGSSHDFGQ